MALFNEILSGRFSRGLARIFRMQVGSASPQLASDIQPVWAVGGRLDDYDQWFLNDERPWMAGRSVAAVAAERPQALIRNPASSGALLLLDWVIVGCDTNSTAFSITPLQTTTDLATASFLRRLDSRLPAAGSPVASVTHGTTAAAAASPTICFRAFSESVMIPLKAIISPGFGILLETITAVNTSFQFGMVWRERELPPDQS